MNNQDIHVMLIFFKNSCAILFNSLSANFVRRKKWYSVSNFFEVFKVKETWKFGRVKKPMVNKFHEKKLYHKTLQSHI